MSPRYAEGTSVTVAQSQADVQQLLTRRGADQVITGWDATEGAMVMFRIQGFHARLAVPKPSLDKLRRDHPRSDPKDLERAEERRMWRALLLLVKAKLEAVEAGLTTVQREFLADALLVDGTRFEEWAAPQLKEMYASGNMPPLLPAMAGPSR